MSHQVGIFVEGKTDGAFIAGYLAFLGYKNVSKIRNGKKTKFSGIYIQALNGIGTLKQNSVLQKYAEQYDTVLFILDADNNFTGNKQHYSSIANKIGVPSHLFLIPNDSQAGNLETLLREISVNKDIYKCIDASKKCLTNKGYKKVPDEKGEIHDYCLANGIINNERDYQDKRYWDLNAPILKPLEYFLTKHLKHLTPPVPSAPPQTP